MRCPALLAKSCDDVDSPPAAATLQGHLGAVGAVVKTLLRTADPALSNLGLSPGTWRAPLERVTLRASLVHDLGKANDAFQSVVRSARGSARAMPQALWHEWVSAWLCVTPPVGPWISSGLDPVECDAFVAAVVGHHLRVDPQGGGLFASRGIAKVTLLAGHPDFRAALELVAADCGLDRPPAMAGDVPVPERLTELIRWRIEATDRHEALDREHRRFVALVKALVVAADVAGSALAPAGGADEWCREALSTVADAMGLAAIARRGAKGRPWRPVQERLAEATARVTLVDAGCGGGKTAGAYLWASRHAAGRKLFFAYPTTHTATEGFLDYLHAEDGDVGGLLHSRRTVDLDLLANGETEACEAVARHRALLAWSRPVLSCTADTVLGLVQNRRPALFAAPAILGAAFVFDEVHQYDDRFFGALLSFVEAFRGAPLLLMTASLPAARRAALEGVVGESGERMTIVPGNASLEALPRYHIKARQTEPPWGEVAETLGRGRKVLWIANSVDRAVELSEAASGRGFRPLTYHARFRYTDRVRRHREVMEAFRDAGAALVISTQVAEISLDISADMLVSDLAPIPALIQRLGRLNRHSSPDDPAPPCPAHVLPVAGVRPYAPEELAAADRWLHGLEGRVVSQADLVDAHRVCAQRHSVAPAPSAWLDGGPVSIQRDLRAAGVTIPVVREEDVPLCMDGKRLSLGAVQRWEIPMLLGRVHSEVRGWKTAGAAFVAPRGRVVYDQRYGARWG